jgi:hypothetical protein
MQAAIPGKPEKRNVFFVSCIFYGARGRKWIHCWLDGISTCTLCLYLMLGGFWLLHHWAIYSTAKNNTKFEKIPSVQHVLHCTENPMHVVQEMKLHYLVPNSYIHVTVSDLYIPRIGLPILLQQNRQTDPKNL